VPNGSEPLNSPALLLTDKPDVFMGPAKTKPNKPVIYGPYQPVQPAIQTLIHDLTQSSIGKTNGEYSNQASFQ